MQGKTANFQVDGRQVGMGLIGIKYRDAQEFRNLL